MKISEREQDGVTVFVLEGRIDSEGSTAVDGALQAAVAANKSRMVLDMDGVTYISSAGLRILADVLTRNREAGGDLKLAAVTKKVMRVLQIIGFTNFFAIFPTVEEAVRDF